MTICEEPADYYGEILFCRGRMFIRSGHFAEPNLMGEK